MRYLILTLLLLAAPLAAQAEDFTEAKEWAERFLAANVEGGPAAAHDILLNDSYLGELHPEVIDGIAQNMNYALEFHGLAIGYEHARTVPISPSVVQLEYVLLRERAPIFWSFTFYKPDDEWLLISFLLLDEWENLGVNRPNG